MSRDDINLSLGFPTRPNTLWVIQLQKMVRGLKFLMYDVGDCTIYVGKKIALIRWAVTVQLTCFFVFCLCKLQKACFFMALVI